MNLVLYRTRKSPSPILAAGSTPVPAKAPSPAKAQISEKIISEQLIGEKAGEVDHPGIVLERVSVSADSMEALRSRLAQED